MQALISYLRVTGLTQEELAKRAGLKAAHLNHFIKKRRAPTVKSLKKLASATGMTLDKLARDL